jgi:hypothetical protein
MFDAPNRAMPTQPPPRKVFLPKKTSPKKALPTRATDLRMRSYVVDEIHAYAAIRDIAVAEAEKEPSSLNVERACIANEFVENCLKPMRPPYEAQYLEQAGAARQLETCQDVRIRLSLLRAHLQAITQAPVTAETTPAA